MRITYTARRTVSGGRTVGEGYTIAHAPQSLDKERQHVVTRTDARDPQVRESNLAGIVVVWKLQPALLTTAEADQFEEWFDSVANAEPFQFDPYATDTADAPRTCVLESKSMTRRLVPTARGPRHRIPTIVVRESSGA